MSATEKPDGIDTVGDPHSQKKPDDQTDEEGPHLPVERRSSKAQDEPLCRPGDKDREDDALQHPDGGNGQAHRVQRPPDKATVEEGEQGIEQGSGAEVAQLCPVGRPRMSQLIHHRVEGDTTGTLGRVEDQERRLPAP